MDFQDRFKGRTSVLTKEGIQGLISSYEIPVKDRAGLSFNHHNDSNFHSQSYSRQSTEPSHISHNVYVPTAATTPKNMTNMKVGYTDPPNRSSFSLKHHPSLRSSLSLPQSQKGLSTNKSVNYMDRKHSISKLSKDIINYPAMVRREVSFEDGYGAHRNSQVQLNQPSYFNPIFRFSESNKDYLQERAKTEVPSAEEEKKNLSAIQKKYRDILRAQKSTTTVQEARKLSFANVSRIDDSEVDFARRPSAITDKRAQKQWDSQSAESSLKPTKSYLSMSRQRGSHTKIFNKIFGEKLDGKIEAETMKAALIKNMSINYLKERNQSATIERDEERVLQQPLPKGASLFLREKLREVKSPSSVLPRVKGDTSISQGKFIKFD